MLRLYEQTKPQEQQVSAAIKKRNRTKFRWGTTSPSSTSSGSATNSSSARSSFKGSTKSSTRSASSSQSSSRDPSHPPKPSGSRRSSLYRPPRLKPTLSPIVESELEDHVSDDERDANENLEHLLLGSPASCSSSASSSLSLPVGSQYAALASPSSSESFTSNSSARDALDKALDSDEAVHGQRYKPRVEYNLRKLLRQVMGLDGLWTCDQQVARHYARIKWGVVRMQADGNCLFRAISDQLYGSESFHGDIRRRIVDFIQREGTLFQPFLATDGASGETLEQYCARMRREGEWGGNPELYAAAKLFNIHVVVHQGPMRRVRIENGRENDPKTGKPPVPYKILHLLYKDDHYNSLRAPPAEDKSDIATVGHKDLKKKYKKAVALLDKISASKHDNLRRQEFVATAVAAAAAAKRDRSPVASPQHSRRQAKTHKSQDEPQAQVQDLGVPVKQTEAEVQAQADDKTSEIGPEQKVSEKPVALGTELMPAFEEADLGVAVSKPTRVTFRRGKAHSICSSSDGETDSESSSSSTSSAQPEYPPRRKQSIEEAPVASPSPLFVAKAAQVLLLDTEEDGPKLTAEDELQASTRVVLPSRLKFHRGIQQQQQTQQQQPQMTATAC